jgi:hypothetical protein
VFAIPEGISISAPAVSSEIEKPGKYGFSESLQAWQGTQSHG